MATKKTVEVDLISAVKAMRAQAIAQQTDVAEMLKALKKKSCPVETLLWAALCGSTSMKQLVATNPKADDKVIDALMLDSETAPWYVIDLLQRPEVYAAFVTDIYGDDHPYPDVESIDDLFYAAAAIFEEAKWAKLVPKVGVADVLQAELLRILWRFGRTASNGVAYMLDYDDPMFLTLNDAVDQISGISARSRNVLRALLRWSQLHQRGGDALPPGYSYERFDPVNLVVDLFVRRHPAPMPFDGKKHN